MPDSADVAAVETTAGTSETGSWIRTRQSFSCTDQVWEDAKTAWAAVQRSYPAWTYWLETALADKAAAVRAELGREVLDPAPDRLPTGRRTVADSPTQRRRHAFTCTPGVWSQARAAWWAQQEDYPAWSDWVEEAIADMTERATPAH